MFNTHWLFNRLSSRRQKPGSSPFNKCIVHMGLESLKLYPAPVDIVIVYCLDWIWLSFPCFRSCFQLKWDVKGDHSKIKLHWALHFSTFAIDRNIGQVSELFYILGYFFLYVTSKWIDQGHTSWKTWNVTNHFSMHGIKGLSLLLHAPSQIISGQFSVFAMLFSISALHPTVNRFETCSSLMSSSSQLDISFLEGVWTKNLYE